MDSPVTDSAGTPPEPDPRADDEPPTASPGSDGGDTSAERAGAAEAGAEKTGAEEAAEAVPDGATAETRADAEASGEAETSDIPDAPAAPPADGDDPGTDDAPRRRHWLRWTALGTSVAVLAASGVGWWFYQKLDGNITTDTTAEAELRTYEKERPKPIAVDAKNILLIGSDTRSGEGNGKYGRDDGGSQRSDTTILLHLAADRQSATAVSIPRDLMVEIPSCQTSDGKRSRKQSAQFNWAFQFGGTACAVRTVEKLTGIRVDHHMVVDFSGFKDMVDAVNGVEVCLKKPVDDSDAHLKLPAGKQTLTGEEALGFVRARKTIGDGSDTERMERQQQFLGSLVKKVQSNGVLLNPTRLYPVLDAATKSLTTDPGLNTLRDLYDLARGLRNVPTEKVQFLTVPRQPYVNDPNRDELVQPDAGELFTQLRKDEPVSVVPAGQERNSGNEQGDTQRDDESAKTDGKPDDTGSSSATPTPSFPGTNAAAGLCE
ncbi:LCP family protein [Streptomyces sp. IB2014 016-6]|uniref:LCP family protein n=1 Tax=Streptomyces sp. IB2014 016-6 TaxID=2517818 RepID=UPI0011C75300|nr:LCP family protein [Streptomyces sp. IB2014 016-6]TXL84037.1 LytR family transcriptional regulator [Streptomyces sp. IB2014 016-6]